MSSIRSRVGDGESAYKHLDGFIKRYIARNGFFLNSPEKKPVMFTIEGNMMANQAVHDMLIQSWAPSIGNGEAGIVRLFPTMPWSWHEASFEDLRAEGGFHVSAKRVKNATVWFKITADANGLLRLRDNFGGRIPTWTGSEMTKTGRNFERPMRKGESIEARLEAPRELPPQPDNVYTPIDLTSSK